MSNHLHVLLVDDDPDIIQAASLRLQLAGYGIVTANDGERGVAMAAQSQPDVILLDVRMPRMDGFAALAELKERSDTKDIPVVMLSASVSDQQAALDAGARFFLRKPYRGEQLLRTVETVIMEQRPCREADLDPGRKSGNVEMSPRGSERSPRRPTLGSQA